MEAVMKANYAQIGKAVKMFYPEMLKEITPRLTKPEPVFIHTILLPALLKRFCELKEISESSVVDASFDRDTNEVKFLFIAVVIKLYNPDLLTGLHSDIMRPTLARELSAVLKAGRTWISQQTNDIKWRLNPYKEKDKYVAFKEEVNKIAKVLEIEFGKS